MRPVESISTLIPRSPKPYVIVIDQAELLAINSNLRGLILGLAIDSVLCKSYVVVVITANAMQAATMVNWNGRQKIAPLGNLSSYRWSKREVDEWISKYSATLTNREQVKEKLQNLAYDAAAPGFLATGVEMLSSTLSDFFRNNWALGEHIWKKK